MKIILKVLVGWMIIILIFGTGAILAYLGFKLVAFLFCSLIVPLFNVVVTYVVPYVWKYTHWWMGFVIPFVIFYRIPLDLVNSIIEGEKD